MVICFAGYSRSNTSFKVWGWQRATEIAGCDSCGPYLSVCTGVRSIMGSNGMVSSERAFPFRDPIGRSERCGVRKPFLHGSYRAMFPRVALPSEIRNISFIRRTYIRDGDFRLLSIAGDETGSNRRGLSSVETTLALEEIC